MKSKIFLQLIILCFVSIFGFEVKAEPISDVEARTWVNDKGQLLFKTFSESNLHEKYKNLDDLFINHVDLDYIAKFVMGKYWSQMTKAQQELYVPLFKRYSLGIYKSFPLDFAQNINFSIIRVRLEPNFTNVVARIDLGSSIKGQKQNVFVVEFRLSKKQNKIKIVDLKLGESSLILSYRNRFYEMIKNNDNEINWFLEDLEMLTISTEQTNQMHLKATIK